MRRVIITFLIYLFWIPNSYSGWVGSVDEREYVTNWDEYPYNTTVQKTASGTCTAQYFENKYLITAAHCVDSGETGSYFIGSKGKFYATLFKKGNYSDADGYREPDWAVYKVTDPRFYSPNAPFVPLSVSTKNNKNVQLAGFSHLRILTNDELRIIRDVVGKMLDERKFADIKFRGPGDAENASTLKLDSASDFVQELEDRLAAQNPPIPPLFGDAQRLKVVKNCSTFGTIKIVGNDTFITHNCDSSQGASGGALLIKNGPGYDIVGLVAQTNITLGTDSYLDSAYATRPESYYREIQSIEIDNKTDSWPKFSSKKEPSPTDSDSWPKFSSKKEPSPTDSDSWPKFSSKKAKPVQKLNDSITTNPYRTSSLPTIQRSRR